jgi:hypothetical protein
VAPFLGEALARASLLLGGQVTTPGTWFDGFWDFVTDNRDRLTCEPAWEIQGCVGFPWALEALAPEAPVRPLFELYVFVESKDTRPGVSAPWPVSSIVLGGNEPAQTGARDRFDRPHDPALAEQIRALGFTPLVGYWGVRCEVSVARDEPHAQDRVGRIITKLPDVVALSLRLAGTL